MTDWTFDNIPPQTGRTAIVTGANTGIGYETALALARKGAHVILACRDLKKAEAAVERITAERPAGSARARELDLSDLESVRRFAEKFAAEHERLDLLINNAGVMVPPYSKTAQGFELQFGTNHLGHFALTGLLLENLLAVPGSRVVTVASMAHRIRAKIHFDDLQFERNYDRVAAYGQSKLANLLFTYELARRLAGTNTIAVAAHPGFSDTELMRHLPALIKPGWRLVAPLVAQNAERGALPTLRAATDPAVENGQYYGPGGPGELQGHPKRVNSSAQSHDRAAGQRLWEVSEELTGVTYPV